jgi:hypothetical protein
MVRLFGPDESERGSRRRSLGLRAAAACLAGAVGLAALFAVTVAGSERLRSALLERSGATTTQSALQAVALAPLRFARASLAAAPVPVLKLDVKFKHMHRIHERRTAALHSGVLSPSDDDFVPAGIDLAGHGVAAKIRLSGDRPELLTGEKWPLRVHTKGDGHAFGLRRLELMPPTARDAHSAGLFLDHLRSEDILAPRFFLVDLVLNGKHVGLMTLEEVAAVELLTHQQRREGPFLRFDSLPGDSGRDRPTAIAPLDPRELSRSGRSTRAFETAATLLSGYLEGALAARDVFDVELTARFLALAEVWGAREAVQWRQLRFYFNPLTARLEPLGQAIRLEARAPDDDPVVHAAPFGARLLADADVAAAYDRALERIAGSLQEPAFEAMLGERDAQELRVLHREYPLRLPFDAGTLLARASLRRRQAAARIADAGEGARARQTAAIALPLPETSLGDTLARHPFLSWDAATGALRATPGAWDVEGSLILPSGIGLTLPAGTVLRFQAREGLIARGPLSFLGREDAPIVLEGPSARKKSRRWSGIYVIESSRPSHWSHVVVRNPGGFERNGWTLDGGVVFRKATVEMEACRFTGDRTNDALNIVRSRFSLRDVEIVDSKLDGFDADFSEGSITGGSVTRAGGDGIDLGGSSVTIRGTHLSKIRDKAISVGEGSRLAASGLVIARVGIGVASKNGSTADVSDSTLREVADVGLVAYTNQPEYGPSSLVSKGNRITGAALPALAQLGNRLVLDGSTLRPVDAAIERLYKD